jgi:hypothetical protein
MEVANIHFLLTQHHLHYFSTPTVRRELRCINPTRQIPRIELYGVLASIHRIMHKCLDLSSEHIEDIELDDAALGQNKVDLG